MSGGSLVGQCLCGSVKVTARPFERSVNACHCTMCRSWSAGPFMAIGCEKASFRADGEHLGVYTSSAWAERLFCKRCGSSVAYRPKDGDFIGVSSGLFDTLPDFVMADEYFIDEKPEYYHFIEKTRSLTGAECFALFATEAEAGGQ